MVDPTLRVPPWKLKIAVPGRFTGNDVRPFVNAAGFQSAVGRQIDDSSRFEPPEDHDAGRGIDGRGSGAAADIQRSIVESSHDNAAARAGMARLENAASDVHHGACAHADQDIARRGIIDGAAGLIEDARRVQSDNERIITASGKHVHIQHAVGQFCSNRRRYGR